MVPHTIKPRYLYLQFTKIQSMQMKDNFKLKIDWLIKDSDYLLMAKIIVNKIS
jgi:hypothetical protein